MMSDNDSTRADIPPQATPRPPAKLDLRRLTATDKTIGIASLVALISIFLPYYSASAYGLTITQSGESAHGWLWIEFLVGLVLVLYLAAIALWDHLPFTAPASHKVLLLVGTIVQAMLIVIALVTIPYSSDGVGLGWGAFVGLVAALVALGVLIVPAFLRARASSNNS
jgi:heme/copper-type cytochrome/quinol oxidase subunit 4